MQGMSDEQLQQLGQRMGVGVTRDMLQQGQRHLANLKPEELDRMAQMQQGVCACM